MTRKFTKIQSIWTSLCRQVRKEESGFMTLQLRPQSNFKKNIFAFLFSEKMRWG